MSVEGDAVVRYVAGMRQLWGLADYGALAARLAPAASALVGAVGPVAGRRVLDLAAGTGTVALMAAEQGARVSACDIAPRTRRRRPGRVHRVDAPRLHGLDDQDHATLAAASRASPISWTGAERQSCGNG